MGRRRKTQGKAHSKSAGQVRIIGGRWRGSKLTLAPNQALRPSTDRSRETLFNWLTGQLSGSRCLDLFAGSGALGLEAASRGAVEVTLVEMDSDSFNCLQQRVATLEDSDGVQLVKADAHQWLQRQESDHADAGYDLILLDPPFDYEDYRSLLIAARRLLKPEGMIYLETDSELTSPDIEGLRKTREKIMGQVAMNLYRVVQ